MPRAIITRWPVQAPANPVTSAGRWPVPGGSVVAAGPRRLRGGSLRHSGRSPGRIAFARCPPTSPLNYATGASPDWMQPERTLLSAPLMGGRVLEFSREPRSRAWWLAVTQVDGQDRRQVRLTAVGVGSCQAASR
jgi:hypothetical protein